MTESFTDWTLVSLSPLSRGWLVALCLAVAVGCAIVLWSYRAAKRRPLLIFMRLVAALLVLGFLVEPALQLRVVRRIRNRLAVIVDRSRSMTLESGAHTRYDNVLRVLDADRAALDKLGESHIVEWFDLDGPLTAAELQTPPNAERSDLIGSLERARESGAGRPLAGIVLLSDGGDNVSINAAGEADGVLSAAARARLQRLEVPVNAVDAASTQSFRDIAISDVLSDEFAFLHNTFELQVVVTATGMGDVTAPVTLRRENDIIATQEVAVGEGRPATVVFKTKPDEIGEFVYSVSLPTFSGDAVQANNQRSFVVQVIRDKIRVLHVAGKPSWDERFLRQHLKENPNVDLISFFILRTPTDDSSINERELSLIPFPVQKLFTADQELPSFDVVIFQDFDHEPYGMSQYLDDIRDCVQNGLGFVMVGGDQSFGRAYKNTPLDEVIPLRLDLSGMRHATITPTPTTAGITHPVTDLARGIGDNRKLWAKLPPWSAVNLNLGLQPNATALVVDPNERLADGSPVPLVAVMDYGEGRSMAVASSSMWHWRFSSQRNGGVSERAYHRFWSNALRWLVRDPEHSRVRVLPEKRRFDVGEPVEVTFKVLGRDYQPVPHPTLRVQLERANGSAVRVDDLTGGETGVARHSYADLETGAYRIVADATSPGERLGSGRGVFVVESTSIELSRAAPRPDVLRAIADASDGRYLELQPGLWDNLAVVDPQVVEVSRRRNIELWDNAWALAVGIVLLAFEWATRRRRGYL